MQDEESTNKQTNKQGRTAEICNCNTLSLCPCCLLSRRSELIAEQDEAYRIVIVPPKRCLSFVNN